MEDYDVIVVGLGCVGISTAYYCAKKGLKVLGIEQYTRPGAIGTSSFGETRLWRDTHGQVWRNDMMREAVGLWKELEEESGLKLMHKFPILTMGSPKNIEFQGVMAQFPKESYLTPLQIHEKFPALHNMPEDFIGILTENSGIVKAKNAMLIAKKLSEEKYGAKLIFSTKVKKVSKHKVITTDGTTYTAKQVVVSCGAFSEPLHHDSVPEEESKVGRWPSFATQTEVREIEYYAFNDFEGMPLGIIELDAEGREFYGMLDGEKLDQYKMGEWGNRNLKLMVDYFQTRLPGKIDSIKYVHVCYITMIDSEEFQYKTDEKGVHYAYGFSGTGFKFFPLHGKIVYEGLLTKTNQEFIPQK